MKQILDIKNLEEIKELKNVVVVGGCFDVFHLGHAIFLESAKSLGDNLIVFLESDEKTCNLKGKDRPINNQENRAKLLIRLKSVDYVIKLVNKENIYEELINIIKPKIIAITKGDKNFKKKKDIGEKFGTKIIEIKELKPDFSTSKIIEKIKKSF